jgi:hypothetical protein
MSDIVDKWHTDEHSFKPCVLAMLHTAENDLINTAFRGYNKAPTIGGGFYLKKMCK